MNYEDLRDWCADARRSVEREIDHLQEQQRTMDNHLQVLEAAGELLDEIARQKDELERKQCPDGHLLYVSRLLWLC